MRFHGSKERKFKDLPLPTKILVSICLIIVTGGSATASFAFFRNKDYKLMAIGAGILVVGALLLCIVVGIDTHLYNKSKMKKIEDYSTPIHEHNLDDGQVLGEDDKFDNPYND